MTIRDFYDEYVDRQETVGVNDRHRAILGWLRRFGLQPSHRVLEIGCGIGTVTELIASELDPTGSIVALDLSPRSIETAQRRLESIANVELIAADFLEASLEGPFNVVVLPDVIEHIPLERHDAVFACIAGLLSSSGFVLLHYPNPTYLEWCHEHEPENLQVVDQPVHADVLLANAYRHGLRLDFLKTYSIWVRQGDYVVAVLRSQAAPQTFTHLPTRSPSALERARSLIGRLIRPSAGSGG